MVGAATDVNNIKDKFFSFNRFLNELGYAPHLPKKYVTSLIKKNEEKLAELTFLVNERALLRKQWVDLTKDVELSPFISSLIFKRKRSESYWEMGLKIKQWMSAKDLDVAKVVECVKQLNGEPIDKIHWINNFLDLEGVMEIEVTPEKLESICDIFSEILILPNHRETILKNISSNYSKLIHVLPARISLFWLEALETGQRPSLKTIYKEVIKWRVEYLERVFNCYGANLEDVECQICAAVNNEELNHFHIWLKIALALPGFAFRKNTLNRDFVASLHEKSTDEYFKGILRLIRASKDVMGEARFLPLESKQPLVLAVFKQEITPLEISLDQYRNQLYHDFQALQTVLPILPRVLIIHIFVHSLTYHHSGNLDLLWEAVALEKAQIETLYNYLLSTNCLLSALYLSRKFNIYLETKLSLLERMFEEGTSDSIFPDMSRVCIDLSHLAKKEIFNLYTEKPLLVGRILSNYPNLVNYVLSDYSFGTLLVTNPKEVIILLNSLHNFKNVFAYINFLQQLLIRFPLEGIIPDDEQEYRRDVVHALQCFVKRNVGTNIPSVFFEIFADHSMENKKQFEAAQWIFSHLNELDRKEVVARTVEGWGYKKTFLNYFNDYLNDEDKWKPFFEEALKYLGASKGLFLAYGPIPLVVSALEIDPNLMERLPPVRVKVLCESFITNFNVKHVQLIERVKFTIAELNDYIEKCLSKPCKSALKVFLKISCDTENFKFRPELENVLNPLDIKFKILILHVALILNDMPTQMMLLQRALWDSALYLGIFHYYETLATKGKIQKKIFSRDELENYLWIWTAITSNDVNKLKEKLSQDTRVGIVSKIQDYLCGLKSAEKFSLALDLFELVPSESRGRQIAEFIESALQTQGGEDKFVIDYLEEELKKENSHDFFVNPHKYSHSLKALKKISGLREILCDHIKEVFKFVQEAIRLNDVDLLQCIFNALDAHQIKIVLLDENPHKNILDWFGQYSERMLLALFDICLRGGLLDESNVKSLLDLSLQRKFKDLFVRIFSVSSNDFKLSDAFKVNYIKVFHEAEYPNILFKIAEQASIEVADAILPHLSGYIDELIAMRDWAKKTIFHHINLQNRVVFKKILPLITKMPEELVDSLSRENYCYMASLGTAFVFLGNNSAYDMQSLCINSNEPEALTNYLIVYPPAENLLISMILLTVQDTQEKKYKVLCVLLNSIFPFHNYLVERVIIEKFLNWDMSQQVLEWMRQKLQTVKAKEYFDNFRNKPLLCDMLFDASHPEVIEHVRSLVLDEDEKRTLLPYFGAKAILEEAQKCNENDSRNVALKLVDVQGEEMLLDEALIYIHMHVINPLVEAQGKAASEENSIIISEKYKQIQKFIVEISIEDIFKGSYALRQKLVPLLPYFPNSKRAILIPLLETSTFNQVLESFPLNDRPAYLRFASVLQKEEFMLTNGIEYPLVKAWKSSKTALEEYFKDSSSHSLLRQKFMEHAKLASCEELFINFVNRFKAALVDSEEVSVKTKAAFESFKTDMMNSVEEVKNMQKRINDLSPMRIVPHEYRDIMTLKIMKNPVTIVDSNNNRFRVDQSTLSLLNGISAFSKATYTAENVIPDDVLKNEISQWLIENPKKKKEVEAKAAES